MTPLEIFILFSTFITVGVLNWLADYAESQCPESNKSQAKVHPEPASEEESHAPPKNARQGLPLVAHYGVGPMP